MTEGLTTSTPAPVPTTNVVNSATLIMGLTKSGKSSLLATVAEYVYETYGLISLYYLCDGGGFPTQMEALVNRGIVRLWRMRTRSAEGLAHDTCQRAAMGWWPSRIDPRTGVTEPSVRLVPPVTEHVQMLCKNGHLVRSSTNSAALTAGMPITGIPCPTCKVAVTKLDMTSQKYSTRTRGFEQVGAALLDGLSSMISWGMDDLSERTGRQELAGEKGALGGVIISGDLKLAGANRAQYGFMQKRAESLVLTSNSIPGLAIPPVWTALSQEGSDEGNLPIVGPQIVGQAKTAEAGQWFGDTMEAVVVETNDRKKYRRLNLQQYVDTTGRRHLCGIRSYPGYLPPYLEEEDKGEDSTASFVDFSMGRYYQLRDAARLKTEAAYKERFPHAPGIPEGDATFGEEPSVTAGKPAGQAAPAVSPQAPAAAATRPTPSTRPIAGRPAVRVGAAAAPPPPVATPVAEPPAPAPATAPAPEPAPPATPSPVTTGPVAAMPPPARPPQRGPAVPPGRRPVASKPAV